MELYAIRHGQSAANAIQAHAGWAQVPLTELGREQAAKTGELLKGMEFDRVIVSDLLRAKETAQIALSGRDFELDPRLRETHVGSLQGRRVVDLTAKEYDLIELLMRNPRRVYSRENLMNVVWGYSYGGDYRTVDVHVRRLREKLELDPANPEYIRTKWGVGYYLSSQKNS